MEITIKWESDFLSAADKLKVETNIREELAGKESRLPKQADELIVYIRGTIIHLDCVGVDAAGDQLLTISYSLVGDHSRTYDFSQP